MCENRVLVLPVNILTVWRAGFTWLHDTLPCVLITVWRAGFTWPHNALPCVLIPLLIIHH